MNVLVIPEDFVLDQYVLKPVIEKLFDEISRRARIEMLREPRLRGTGEALDPEVIADIVEANRAMTDLFLLVVDRDCDREGNAAKLRRLEEAHPDVLLGCLAVEEVECWMLALHDPLEPAGTSWTTVRAECDPKERFADPFLERRGASGPGGGRKAAMRELKGNWRRLISRCSELGDLKKRIEEKLAKS